MTIAPFKSFMTAIDRDIERKRIEAMPDFIPSASGQSMIPNYAKPGIAEAVERRAFEDELANNPPTGSLSLRLQMLNINRFEEAINRRKS